MKENKFPFWDKHGTSTGKCLTVIKDDSNPVGMPHMILEFCVSNRVSTVFCVYVSFSPLPLPVPVIFLVFFASAKMKLFISSTAVSCALYPTCNHNYK